MFGRGGRALVVLLGAGLVAMTAGSVVAPPRPISTATAAALVTTAAKSTPRLTPAANRVAVAAAASPHARLARRTKIVLNPGHNGGNWSHPGAISRQVPAGFGRYKNCDTTGTATNAGFSEHAFNWDVALRVRKTLQSRGVTVIMTRPSDHGVGPCVDARARIGNQAGVAGVVSIHARRSTFRRRVPCAPGVPPLPDNRISQRRGLHLRNDLLDRRGRSLPY